MSKILFKRKQGKRVIKHIVTAAIAGGILYMGFIGAKIDAHASNMRDAFTITRDMKAGWNLGNSLESENHEEAWGNPRITKEMIDGIRRKGFTTLRIPVRWDDNYSDPYNYVIKVKIKCFSSFWAN